MTTLEFWSIAGNMGQAIGGVGAVLIALVAYLHSRRSFQLESMNLYITHWRELNRLFLDSDRIRNARGLLTNKTPGETDDVSSLLFIYINQALLAYYAWKFGAMPRHELEAEFRAIWHTMDSHRDRALSFLHAESYPSRFVKMFDKASTTYKVGDKFNG